jgi:hypothetical protein
MKLPAETVYRAIFAQACSINAPQANGNPSQTPLITMSRRWVHWDQVGDIPMPALYQLQPADGIRLVHGERGITKYELTAFLFLYFAVDSGNLNASASPLLNSYFNAMDLAFQPSLIALNGKPNMGGRQQLGLGPALEECWIDGRVPFDEGLLAPPAMLVFTVKAICG